MNNTEKAKKFWSKGFGARIYRKHAGNRFLKMHQKASEDILSRNPNDILDIACGPGDFLFHLSKLDEKLNLVGTDMAPGMVDYASQKLLGKAKILESKGGDQPFREGSFDAITIMMAFHHFSDKLEVLQSIKKILRQDGILIIADVVAKSDLQKKFWNLLEKVIGIRGHIEHYTEKDIKDLAEKAGFASFSIEYIPGMPKRYMVCKFLKED